MPPCKACRCRAAPLCSAPDNDFPRDKENAVPLFWRKQLAVGHPDIDADHRYLIHLINTVELVLRFPENPEHLKLAFDELQHYAAEHFEREEKIQIAWGYTHYDEHQQEHRKLLDSLALLRKTMEEAMASSDPQEALRQHSGYVTDFLRKWLVDHVMKNDLKMVDLFKRSAIF
jgi:hemerythrin